MLPKTHLILGLIFSLLVFFIFPSIGLIGFFTIWISSFMIDIDHYLFYAFYKKDLSPKNAFKWFLSRNRKFLSLPKNKRPKDQTNPCLLHGIEAIIILVILSFFNNFFFFILMGFLFHELLDFISITYYGFSYNHILSQTYNVINFRKRTNED